jgi:hypothetical protein
MTHEATASTTFEEDEVRPTKETLPIAEIALDREILPRTEDPDTIAAYAERMAEGDKFPPVRIMRDNVTNYLVGGLQTLKAARRGGRKHRVRGSPWFAP